MNVPHRARTPLLLLAGLIILSGGVAQAVADELFPTPDILEDNVAFWKKIYTEVSLDEGLLHDREYPMIIYKKMTVGQKRGRRRTRLIRAERKRVAELIRSARTKQESEWSDEEKKIVTRFRTHADEKALRDADNRIRFQQGQRERFLKGLYRSGAYLDSIETILSSYGIPLQLKYLPHVESSFNPYAYSKVGAAGLWQFIRSTGRQYMKVGYEVDERRDPFLATHAAAKLLRHNYSVIKSWPLAITAYNHGLNGMKRAVASTGSRDIAVIIQKHSSRSFRFASKNFYSCFLAAKEIAANPEQYFDKVTYAPAMAYHQTRLDHYMEPSVVCKYLDLPIDTIILYNPAIRPVVFKSGRMLPKGTILKIPRTLSQQQARLALAAMPDSLKIEEPPRPRYYRVRRGDNLYAIARRLDISVQELALENNINRINRIYAGQVLRVPGAPAAEKKEPVVQVATAKPTSPPAPSKPKVQPVVAETKPESKPEPKVEPVILSTPKKAEKKIAAAKPRPEPDSVPAEVAALPDTLEELVLARADTATAGKRRSTKVQARFDMDIYELELAPYPRSRTAAITVAVNETIGHYADWLDIPTWHIRRANRMGRRSHIRLGQRLSIPGDAEALEQFKQRRLEYHMGLEEDFYWQYKVTDTRIHTIERGDNLWTLCHQEGEIPLWLLKKHNRQLDLSRLMPGEKVRLPIVEEKTEEDYAMEAAALQDPVSSRMLPREPLLSPLRGVRPAP